MVKPPVVFIVGLLKARRRGIDTDLGVDLQPGRAAALRPPNVAGWDESHWLDTSTFGAAGGRYRDGPGRSIDPGILRRRRVPQVGGERALRYWGKPASPARPASS